MSIPQPLSLLPGQTSTIIPPIPIWLYKYLAAFPVTGLLGMDHFALGSQFTGFLKLFVNMITLGSWYAYDIVQVYNAQNLRDNGLQIPFLEFGQIGKGRLDDEPMSIMSKNTKVWLYILIFGLFAGLYFVSTFFVTTNTDLFSEVIYFFSNFTFYISFGIAAYILFFYFTGKQTGVGAVSPVGDPVSSLLSSSGLSTPVLGQKTTGVSSIFNQLPITPTIPGMPSFSGMFGGGDMNELTKIARESMKGSGKESNQHIYFGLILALLPLSGFLVYTLRNIKKKSHEVSADSR